jgi:hypothetical protein
MVLLSRLNAIILITLQAACLGSGNLAKHIFLPHLKHRTPRSQHDVQHIEVP